MKNTIWTLLTVGFLSLLAACVGNERFGFKSLGLTRDGTNEAPGVPDEVTVTVNIDTDGDGIPDITDDDDDNDGTPDDTDDDDDNDGTDDGDDNDPTDVTVTMLQETWPIVKTAQTNNQVLYFVTDTSGSMDEDGPAMAETMSQTAFSLAEDFPNLCIGIMRGYLDTSKSGKLEKAPNADYCLCVDEYSKEELAAQIKGTFESFNYTDGANGEGPDWAAYQSVVRSDAIAFNDQVSGGRCGGDVAAIYIGLGDENSMREAKSFCSYSFTVEGTSKDGSSGSLGACGEAEKRAKVMSTEVSTGVYETWFNTAELKSKFQSHYGVVPYSYNFIGHVAKSDPNAAPNNSAYEQVSAAMQADVAAFGGLFMDIMELRNSNKSAFINTVENELAPLIETTFSYTQVYDVTENVCTTIPFAVKVDGADVTSMASLVGAKRFHLELDAIKNKSSLVIQYAKASDPLCP